MNTNINLVTTCNFRGRDYLVSLRTLKQSDMIEVKTTDKKTAEEWIGSYNASYIENLTHKTGNYKRFDTFISMLKSGLLNTSHCVTLDLLKFEDLEMLRSRTSQLRYCNVPSSQILQSSSNNRRYLIVTYSVEFDRIHYPLALEYCGPPDPRVLQETIQRLEKQVSDLQFQLDNNDWGSIKSEVDTLQKKVVDVTTENYMLKQQIKDLNTLKKNKDCNKEIDSLLKYTYTLESKLQFEREVVEKLKKENLQLMSQLEEAITSEKLMRGHLSKAPVFTDNFTNEDKFMRKDYSASPNRKIFTVSCAERPFSRTRNISKERKAYSARSFINYTHSSSEESLGGSKGKFRRDFRSFTPPKTRASSPSFSELSHNSEISRCACRNCLHNKFGRKEDMSFNSKSKGKHRGKAKLLKRIQSLEKLISGIVLS